MQLASVSKLLTRTGASRRGTAGACSVYCCRLVHVVVRGQHLCTVWRKLKSGDAKI